MKNLFIILFSFFFLQNVFAQGERDTVVKKESRWSVGIFFSPQMSYRQINSDISYLIGTTNEPGEWNSYRYNSKFDIKKTTYNFGANLSVKLSKKINYRIDLLYNYSGFKTKTIDTIIVTFHDPSISPWSTTYVNSESIDYSRYDFIFQNNIEYLFLQKQKISIGISLGLQVNYLLREKIDVFNQQFDFHDKFSHSNLDKKWLYGGNVGIEFQYSLSKSLNIAISPNFTYCITPIERRGVGAPKSKTNFYNCFFKVGINYNLYK